MSNIKTPEEIDRLLGERRIDKKIAEEYKELNKTYFKTQPLQKCRVFYIFF